MLTLEGVTYRHPGATAAALHGVTLEVADGRVTGLVGPAEAGKSSLCLVAGGLAPRVSGGSLVGSVSIDGADVRDWPMQRLVEQVVTGLQDPAGQLTLIADTVHAEVAFGPANLGLPVEEVLARTDEALAAVGIGDLRERHPATLSGGQQQLVVLAGLLAMRPRHLVLDEPLAHLDAAATRAVLDAVAGAAARGTAVLIAEQRVDELARVCDSIAVLARGNILAQGPAASVLADPGVAALGIDQPAMARLRRRLSEAGLDPGLVVADG